ncbi:MAG: hypothetical protein AAB225_17355, partial [Acidobacteriota bacterium]
ASQKTVVRGAYGIFWAPPISAAAGTIGLQGFRTDTPFRSSLDGVTPYAYLRDPYPDGFVEPTGSSLGLLTYLGQGVAAPLRETLTAYSQNWNFGVQREIPGAILIEASYVGNRGIQLPAGDRGYNQLPIALLARGNELLQSVRNPLYGLVPAGTMSQPTVQLRYLLRPFPQFDGVTAIETSGASATYHSFQLKAERRLAQGLSLLLAYTNAKLIDDSSQTQGNYGSNGAQQDIYYRRGDRTVSPQDVSQRLVISYICQLPVGRGRKFGGGWNRALDPLLGGWEVNGITTIARGLPLAVSASNNSNGFTPGVRPHNNGRSARLSGSVDSRFNRYFDTSVFSQPAPYTLGNVARTLPDVRADGERNFDLSVFKVLRVTEKLTFQFRTETFNAFNTPRFGGPGTGLNSNNFGMISSQANSPRQMQFGLKALF